MNREELIALRDALTTMLEWPAGVCQQIAALLTPQAAKPNGVDAHPPPVVAPAAPVPTPEPEAPARRPESVAARNHGGARERAQARDEERKLLAAMRTSPGASANALARACKCSRSSVQSRLRRLSASGAIEKSPDGWRIAGDGSRPTAPRRRADGGVGGQS